MNYTPKNKNLEAENVATNYVKPLDVVGSTAELE